MSVILIMTTLQRHNAMVVSHQQRRTTQPYVFYRFHFLTTQSAGVIPEPPTKRCQRQRPLWKRAKSVRSILKIGRLGLLIRERCISSSGRDVYPHQGDVYIPPSATHVGWNCLKLFQMMSGVPHHCHHLSLV